MADSNMAWNAHANMDVAGVGVMLTRLVMGTNVRTSPVVPSGARQNAVQPATRVMLRQRREPRNSVTARPAKISVTSDVCVPMLCATSGACVPSCMILQ